METTNPAAQVALAQAEYDNSKKSAGVAYAFWFFLGVFGGHRYYAGDKGVGTAQLLTLGGVGVWALIDVFFIGARIKDYNNRKRVEIFSRYGINA